MQHFGNGHMAFREHIRFTNMYNTIRLEYCRAFQRNKLFIDRLGKVGQNKNTINWLPSELK